MSGELKCASLSGVVMPLVRLMRTEGLSWSDKAEVADAIKAALRMHESMEREQQHLRGILTGAACSQKVVGARG